METHMNKHSLFISSFKFLAKLFCLSAILIFLFFIILLPQYSYGYNAGLLDKMNHLESIEEPKIVLIGNSNLVFGIKSEMLEEALGMPVANMGLHGGLGNIFHEEMAKINLREGDIIVVAHTAFADNDKLADPVLTWAAIENHLKLWQLIRFKDIPDMYFAFPTYAKKALTRWSTKMGNDEGGTMYARFIFNEYGDASGGNKCMMKESDFAGKIGIPGINDPCINRLNDLNQYITEHGAIMVVAAYPIAYGPDTPPAEEWQAFQAELETRLDCPVISDYTDYFFEYKYFYNSELHLTDDGAVLRTNQLIDDLERYLQSL